MRIAFIANPEAPGGWYRGIGPMVALHQRGHDIVQVWRPKAGIRGDLVAKCDLLHVYRAHEDEVLEIVRHAKRRGLAVVYDNDDDMRAVPRDNAAHRDYGGFAGDRALRQIRRLVQQADLAIAASSPIADRFREYGAMHVQTIENYVPDATLEASAPSNGDRVVAGWLAGNEHHLDTERLPLAEEVGRALDAHRQLVVETIGVRIGLRHERYRHVDRVDFFDLPPKLAEYDVGLAPIADIPFNRARSSIKVKEYAALGRPWLASPVGPYAALGEKEGGRLVPDDRWAEELGRMVEKPRERRKLAKHARKWGRTQAISANVGLWEKALSAAVVRAGGTPRPAGPPRARPTLVAREPV
ncbi:MAG TPA: glycosyltransferase [Conexibacter sp.]|nr:glycosyltransferase [Conexibacter sp.]